MKTRGYAAFAVGVILLCVVLAILGFPAGVLGGFNAHAIAFYIGLLASTGASFCLLANRRELSPKALRLVAAIAGAGVLGALSPLLFWLGYALLNGS